MLSRWISRRPADSDIRHFDDVYNLAHPGGTPRCTSPEGIGIEQNSSRGRRTRLEARGAQAKQRVHWAARQRRKQLGRPWFAIELGEDIWLVWSI